MLAKSETKLLLLAASISHQNKTIMNTTTHHRDLQEPGRVQRMAKSRIGLIVATSMAATYTINPSGSMSESGGLAPPYLLPRWLLSVLRPAGLLGSSGLA
jgi:hypothetical protein